MTLVVIIQKESYAPLLLKSKALRMRAEDGRNDILAPGETLGEETVNSHPFLGAKFFRVHILRPFHMLFTEAPLMYATLWTSFCYAIIFIFFRSLSCRLCGTYGFNAGEVGLAFLLSVSASLCQHLLLDSSTSARSKLELQQVANPPRIALAQVALSAPLFAIGFLLVRLDRALIHPLDRPHPCRRPNRNLLMLAFNALVAYAANATTSTQPPLLLPWHFRGVYSQSSYRSSVNRCSRIWAPIGFEFVSLRFDCGYPGPVRVRSMERRLAEE